MYDYYYEVKEDVINAIFSNYTKEEIAEKLLDKYAWADELNDDLWTDDAVTGNGSGSYTFNRAKAAEYVIDNPDLVEEMVKEYCVSAETVAGKFLASDWEYFDVSIRCYVLGSAIEEAIEEVKHDFSDRAHNA